MKTIQKLNKMIDSNKTKLHEIEMFNMNDRDKLLSYFNSIDEQTREVPTNAMYMQLFRFITKDKDLRMLVSNLILKRMKESSDQELAELLEKECT